MLSMTEYRRPPGQAVWPPVFPTSKEQSRWPMMFGTVEVISIQEPSERCSLWVKPPLASGAKPYCLNFIAMIVEMAS
jgi:hypothetical protein